MESRNIEAECKNGVKGAHGTASIHATTKSHHENPHLPPPSLGEPYDEFLEMTETTLVERPFGLGAGVQDDLRTKYDELPLQFASLAGRSTEDDVCEGL